MNFVNVGTQLHINNQLVGLYNLMEAVDQGRKQKVFMFADSQMFFDL